jgi:predicted branched-subunit amino acid permease
MTDPFKPSRSDYSFGFACAVLFCLFVIGMSIRESVAWASLGVLVLAAVVMPFLAALLRSAPGRWLARWLLKPQKGGQPQ